MNSSFSITNLTRNKTLPQSAPFARIKNKTVGKKFSARLIFAGKERMRALNRAYRKKTYAPNVLAFRFTGNEGEVFICQEIAAREARREGILTSARITYLFIHGLLHLKGKTHSVTMTQSERLLCKFFRLPEP